MRALPAIALLALLGPGLSGCVVYHVASTAVGAATTVAGTAVDAAGAIVRAPLPSGSDNSGKKDQ